MNSKVILEKKWSYVVFEEGDQWILTFLHGRAVQLDASIILNEGERRGVQGTELTVESIIDDFCQNREAYRGREIVPARWP